MNLKLTYQCNEISRYDGTNRYLELIEIHRPDGTEVLDQAECTRIANTSGGQNIWIYTDNPAVYGLPPTHIKVAGKMIPNLAAGFEDGDEIAYEYDYEEAKPISLTENIVRQIRDVMENGTWTFMDEKGRERTTGIVYPEKSGEARFVIGFADDTGEAAEYYEVAVRPITKEDADV